MTPKKTQKRRKERGDFNPFPIFNAQMKKLLIFISVHLFSFSSFSQVDSTKKDSIAIKRGISTVNEQYKKYIPNFSPQSPNTAQSTKFGDYAVNLATGIPDIQIPLYSATAGSLSLPITLKYHASGHKIKSKATWVGWGWSLDVGDGISRTVQGLPDDMDGTTGSNYINTTLLSSIDPCSSTANYNLINAARNNLQDLEPDIFSYSTSSSSGKFILAANGAQPFLFPWQAIKVNKTINSSGYISEFDLIETNGTAFKYGKDKLGNLAQESQNSIHGRWSKQYVSNWNLTQILSPNNKDSINLYYQNGGNVYQEDYQWSASITANQSGNYFTNTLTATAQPSTSSSTSTENNIRYIKFPNGEIEFIQSLPTEIRSDATNSRYLKQIKIYNYADNQKVLLRTVDFFYSYFKNMNNQDARLKLDSISINHSSSVDRQVYKFNYFTNNFSWDDSFNSHLKQDFFGSFNGQNNQSLITVSSLNVATATSPNPIPITNGGANRQSSSAYSKECVLEKITFPSGAFTTFDFENNQFFNGTSGVLGSGLRVKSIKTFKNTTAQPITKRYQYASEHGLGIGKLPTNWKPDTSDMVFHQTIHYSSPGILGSDIIGLSGTADQFIISPYSQIEMGSIDGAPVYYTQVDEYFEDDTATIKNGKNQYLFSFEKDVLYSKPYANPKTYNSHKRGLLLNKKTFTNTNLLLSEQINQYQDFKVTSVLGGGFVANKNIYVEGGVYGICSTNMPISPIGPEMQYYSHSYFTGNRKLISTTETIDNVNTTKTFTYDDNLFIKTTKEDDSYTNHYRISESIYPTDAIYSSDPMATELKNRHMIDIPLETIEKEDLNGTINTLFKQKTVYGTFTGNNTRGLTNNILPKEIWVALGGIPSTGGTLEKRVEYIAYDTFGNPSEYKQDEVSNSMVWGYNNSLLIGLVKNATAGQVNTALSSTGLNISSFSVTNLSNTQFTTLANFRAALPNTQVSWFTHIPQVGLSNTFAPNGLRNFYEYDSFQRLTTSKDHEGNLTALNLYKTTPTNNYIRTSNLRVATTNTLDALSFLTAKISYQLFDGLGRPTQTLGYGQTPDLKTLLGSEISYDRWGRTIQNLLPVSSGTLTFSPINNAKNLAQSFYNDTAPTDSTIYEASPLNRLKANFGAGGAWRTNNKNTQIFYESAGTDIRYYTVNNANSVILNGFYPANSLFKKRIIDEQGNTNIEISDKRGRLIQKQTQKDNSGNWLTTYYCYDGLGRPRAIIQPIAYNLNQTINATDQAHRDFVFAFEYDSRGRLIREDIPGAGERYSVYDKADRLVMQNNALQSETGKWNFWRYDAFDREVMRGETGPIGYTQSYWQYYFDQQTIINEAWDYNTHYFTNTSFPSNTAIDYSHVKQYQIYDDYDFAAAEHAFKPDSAYHPRYTNAKGLLTLTVKRDLNLMDQGQYRYYTDTYYYDSKNSPIQIFSTHDMGGANNNTKYNLKNIQYNFAGEVVKERIYGQFTSGNISLLTEFDRNHVGLVTNTYLTINGGLKEKISTQSYDAINRLLQKTIMPDGTFTVGGFQDYINRNTSPTPVTNDIAKKAICLLPGVLIGGSNIPYSATINPNGVGGTTINSLQKMDYLYHIRGGLRGINLDANQNPTPNQAQGDLYSYKLDYETANQWNGNIGKQTWNTQNQTRGYNLSYDPSQRLANANYFGATGENYNLNDLTFDDNGNIKTLKRYGKGNSGYGIQDNLTYNYQGNRLLGLTDAAGNNHGNTYHKDNGSNNDYTYYSNGSLKTDGNRGITNIAYQTYLNRTAQVNFSDGTSLKNLYDGGGNLFKREKSNSETWHYVDRFVIKNGQLYSINIPDGRMIKNGNNWEKEFYYKDHLGSSAVTFSAQNGQLVAKEYAPVDPYGLDLFGINQANSTKDNFTYQSKEKLDDFGILGTNDFGARVFDKHSLRWWGVDPLAEKREWLTPYNYVQNNPINRIDPNGLTDFTLNKKTGEVSQVGETNDQPDRILKTNRHGEVKHRRNGEAKVAVEGIEQGILKDGQNFKNKDQLIGVGGKGNPSVDGVKSFTLDLSEYLGVEIKGFTYSSDGSGNASDMVLGKYENNTNTKSYGRGTELYNKYGPNYSALNVTEDFHTHPDGKLGATESNRELSGDVESLQNSRPFMPNANFIILYRINGQRKPGQFNYNHQYRP